MLRLYAFLLVLLIAGCQTPSSAPGTWLPDRPPPHLDNAPDGPPLDAAVELNVADIPVVVPKAEPKSRWGNAESYVVRGKRYFVMPTSKGYREEGTASWYGRKFHGRRTSNGETYDMYLPTAAHKSLPLPAYVRVTNKKNGRSIVLRVNDRGPFHGKRIIDVSYAAAQALGFVHHGTAPVLVEALQPETEVHVTATENNDWRDQSYLLNRLFVQVGAFSTVDNAERMRNALKNQSFEVMIKTVLAAGSTLHRVQIGPLSTIESTESISERLSQLGYNDFRIVVD